MLMDKIREMFNKKYLDYIINNIDMEEKEELEMWKLIEELLQDDNCFKKINMNLALNILVFIGYTKEETVNLYKELLSESKESLKGKYKLVG